MIVDYPARMTTGDARYQDVEIKTNIHLAQKLTRNYMNGRGIVFLTPVQVNREANKAARKASDKEEENPSPGGYSTFYDLNAIANFSEYQYDMDLIISVYSDAKMKARNELVMETLKARKGKLPPMAYMELHSPSGRVITQVGGRNAQISKTTTTEKQMQDEDDVPAALSIPVQSPAVLAAPSLAIPIHANP